MTSYLSRDDVIIMLKEGLNREIPVESGTFNKFCNRCGYRNGHPLKLFVIERMNIKNQERRTCHEMDTSDYKKNIGTTYPLESGTPP